MVAKFRSTDTHTDKKHCKTCLIGHGWSMVNGPLRSRPPSDPGQHQVINYILPNATGSIGERSNPYWCGAHARTSLFSRTEFLSAFYDADASENIHRKLFGWSFGWLNKKRRTSTHGHVSRLWLWRSCVIQNVKFGFGNIGQKSL